MIQLSSAGKRFGPKLLFEDRRLADHAERRVGLVGANGTGKSTLLKSWRGLETLDYGAITRAKGITAGYLPQDGLSLSGRSVFAECMSVFGDLLAMEQEMEALTRQHGGTRPRRRRICRRSPTASTQLEHEFRARDGYALEAQVGTVLAGLGFHARRLDIAAPKSSPAAGRCASRWPSCCWKSPTCCCSTSPPTTSTSKPATGWKSIWTIYPYAFVLISHDRYFLDVTVSRSSKSGTSELHFYTGNYDAIPRRRRPSGARSSKRPTRTSRTASSSSKSSSTASATRPPRPSRCRAASRNWRRSSASRFRQKRRPSTSRFRSPSRAGASWRSSQDVAKSYGDEARCSRT